MVRHISDDDQFREKQNEIARLQIELERQRLEHQERQSNKNLDQLVDGLDKLFRPVDRMISGDYKSGLQLLKERADTIDIKKIGLICTSLNDFYLSEKLNQDLYQIIKYGVAQALLQGIGGGQTEGAISVREIIPNFDFCGPDGITPIPTGEWIQPHADYRYQGDPHKRYVFGRNTHSIYTTSKNSKNDQKVLIIYGLEFLNGWNGVGVDEVQFWRRGVKIINRIPIDINKRSPVYAGLDKVEFIEPERQDNGGKAIETSMLRPHPHIYHNNIMILQTPIMYKKDDLADIKFGFDPSARNVTPYDYIKIKGFTFEPLGSCAMG